MKYCSEATAGRVAEGTDLNIGFPQRVDSIDQRSAIALRRRVEVESFSGYHHSNAVAANRPRHDDFIADLKSMGTDGRAGRQFPQSLLY